jgi:UDP-glucose 4-epimerase
LIGAQRVVNTSTGGAIYGKTATMPTPETIPPNPVSAYGLSKLCAEQYAKWFRETCDLDIVTLRYGNVYGPRQYPNGDARVIATYCDRALSGRRPIIFGDGRQTRDYVFLDDIVGANLAAASTSVLKHAVYNVGSGTETDLIRLAAMVARAAEVSPPDFAPEFRAPRPGEVLRSCLDVGRARRDLGLPEPTDLADGLRATLSWLRTSRSTDGEQRVGDART